MSNRDDLKYMPIDHGRTNTGRIGNVYYNEDAIRKARKQSARDKARIERQYKFKMVTQTIVVAAMVVATVALISIYAIGYTGYRDTTYQNREDQYVANLGTIVKNYSEEDVINLANMTIEKVRTKHGPQETIDYLNVNLEKIASLKSQGRGNEIGQYLANICSIASGEDFFLPGYDYTVSSFPEYVVEDVLGLN